MRQSGAGWPALAALAIALLFACVTRDSDEEEAGWSGVIRNTCGPAGGDNALMIRIGEGRPMAECGATTEPDTAASRYHLYIADVTVDSLSPGMVLRDSLSRFVQPDQVVVIDQVLTFSVESVTSRRVTGRLEAQSYQDGTPLLSTRHDVALSVCPRIPEPCF